MSSEVNLPGETQLRVMAGHLPEEGSFRENLVRIADEMEALRGKFRRGDLSEPLGGKATAGGHDLYCGDCSPEPLHEQTAVSLKVREVGIELRTWGEYVSVDVLECPRCGRQIIR